MDKQDSFGYLVLERLRTLREKSESILSSSKEISSLLSTSCKTQQSNNSHSKRALVPQLITPETYANSFSMPLTSTLPQPLPESKTNNMLDDDDLSGFEDEDFDRVQTKAANTVPQGMMANLSLSDENMVVPAMVLRPHSVHPSPLASMSAHFNGASSDPLDLIEGWIKSVRSSEPTRVSVESTINNILEIIFKPPHTNSTLRPLVACEEDYDFPDTAQLRALSVHEVPADIDDIEAMEEDSPRAGFIPGTVTTLTDGMIVPNGVQFVNGTWVSNEPDETFDALDDIDDFDFPSTNSSHHSAVTSPSVLCDDDLYDDVDDRKFEQASTTMPAPKLTRRLNTSMNTMTKEDLASFVAARHNTGNDAVEDEDAAAGAVLRTSLALIKGAHVHPNHLTNTFSPPLAAAQDFPDDIDGMPEDDGDEQPERTATATPTLPQPRTYTSTSTHTQSHAKLPPKPRQTPARACNNREDTDSVPEVLVSLKNRSRETYPADLDHIDCGSEGSDLINGSHSASTTSVGLSTASTGRRSRRSSVNVDIHATRVLQGSRSASHTPVSSSSHSLSIPSTPDMFTRTYVCNEDLAGLSDMDDDDDDVVSLASLRLSSVPDKYRNEGANKDLHEFEWEEPLDKAIQYSDVIHTLAFDPRGNFGGKMTLNTPLSPSDDADVLLSQYPHLHHLDRVLKTIIENKMEANW